MLRWNALYSIATGGVAAAAHVPTAMLLAVPPGLVIAIGVSLIGFGLAVAWYSEEARATCRQAKARVPDAGAGTPAAGTGTRSLRPGSPAGASRSMSTRARRATPTRLTRCKGRGRSRQWARTGRGWPCSSRCGPAGGSGSGLRKRPHHRRPADDAPDHRRLGVRGGLAPGVTPSPPHLKTWSRVQGASAPTQPLIGTG